MTLALETERTRVQVGAGSLSRLGDEVRALGATRVLLVTDPGVVAAGHAARAEASLKAAGVTATCFDAVHENPTTRDVAACLEVAAQVDPQLFVAVGGGSAMDTAKGADFLLTNGGSMADHLGPEPAPKALRPIVAVPTTAGTGSEIQSFALIVDADSHRKMACGDPGAAPKVALLDPELTLTLPRRVTAHAGLDALVHAVETAVCTRRSEHSVAHAHEAFRLGHIALERVLKTPEDLEARDHMLRAACHAGLAIELSMLGAAHATANPLTARIDLDHGAAVGLMLPPVIRFNAQDLEVAALYDALAQTAGLTGHGALIERIEQLLALCEVAPRLREHGVEAAQLDALAEDAATQWTGKFNPRPVGVPELREIYAARL